LKEQVEVQFLLQPKPQAQHNNHQQCRADKEN
jgi:hypothetical protein